jgi:hypothetical protein
MNTRECTGAGYGTCIEIDDVPEAFIAIDGCTCIHFKKTDGMESALEMRVRGVMEASQCSHD